MVSARANVEPMQIERRTAAAAPVTAFTPTIPGNPIMPLSGSSALEPCLASLESHYPVTPYARRKGDGTPRRPNPTETLDVGHPGHTFDLEWYLGGGPGARKRTRATAQVPAKPVPRHRKAPDSRNRRANGSPAWLVAAWSWQKR